MLIILQLIIFSIGFLFAAVAAEMSGLLSAGLFILCALGVTASIGRIKNKPWSYRLLQGAWILFLYLPISIIFLILKDRFDPNGYQSSYSNSGWLYLIALLVAPFLFLYFNFKATSTDRSQQKNPSPK